MDNYEPTLTLIDEVPARYEEDLMSAQAISVLTS